MKLTRHRFHKCEEISSNDRGRIRLLCDQKIAKSVQKIPKLGRFEDRGSNFGNLGEYQSDGGGKSLSNSASIRVWWPVMRPRSASISGLSQTVQMKCRAGADSAVGSVALVPTTNRSA
jgi:hypothetical protein